MTYIKYFENIYFYILLKINVKMSLLIFFIKTPYFFKN